MYPLSQFGLLPVLGDYEYSCYHHSFFFFNFIYFWLHLFFVAVRGCSLIVARGGSSLVAVHRLLIAVAFLDAGLGL